jgi:hypothetical protein
VCGTDAGAARVVPRLNLDRIGVVVRLAVGVDAVLAAARPMEALGFGPGFVTGSMGP